MVWKARSIWEAVPEAAIVMRSPETLETVKPDWRRKASTAVTWAPLGENRDSHWLASQVMPVLRIAGRGNRPGERRRAGPIGEREIDVEADAAGRIDSGHTWRRRGRRGGGAGEPDATGRSRERA